MKIDVVEYEGVSGLAGYIEPEDRSWIVYVTTDGEPLVWTERDETGAVIGDPLNATE